MKIFLDDDVLSAARKRIVKVFDEFPRVYVSFSAGKDSGVLLHLVIEEAIKRGRKIGVLLVDLEGQYKLTIDYALHMFELYKDHIEPYWLCLPINLRNAVSQFNPQWLAWDPKKKDDWIRQPPELAITDVKYFDWFRTGMEFEELVPAFGKWYSNGRLTACFVGIRTQESLNRYRTIARDKKSRFENLRWTTWCGGFLYNAYPIYDWGTEDIWRYYGKFNKPYNKLYDYMHKAGLSIHQMRICQPYGDDQRKGLWLFHLIEPETWGRVVARVSGANQGALYANERGNVLGVNKITKPNNVTWRKFVSNLLESMPPHAKEHFENKIAIFLKWYSDRGYGEGIPDDGGVTDKKTPSWQRVCKALLRNDYWCKGLSFSQHKSEAYEKYKKLMKKRRRLWGYETI